MTERFPGVPVNPVARTYQGLVSSYISPDGTEVPHVLLPDDGHWNVGDRVTVLLRQPPTDDDRRWRPYSTRLEEENPT